MPVYSMHQAKTHLSELVRMVERGEVITITRSNIPVALLTRIGALPQPRRPGTLAETMRLNRLLDYRDGPRRERRPGLHGRGTSAAPPARGLPGSPGSAGANRDAGGASDTCDTSDTPDISDTCNASGTGR